MSYFFPGGGHFFQFWFGANSWPRIPLYEWRRLKGVPGRIWVNRACPRIIFLRLGYEWYKACLNAATPSRLRSTQMMSGSWHPMRDQEFNETICCPYNSLVDFQQINSYTMIAWCMDGRSYSSSLISCATFKDRSSLVRTDIRTLMIQGSYLALNVVVY